MRKYLYQIAIHPLRLYWFLFRPRTFGVKSIVQRPDGSILFVRTSYGEDSWTLPGGGQRLGESAQEAVIREIREETSIELATLDLVGTFETTQEYKRDHVSVFEAFVDQDQSLRLNSGELTDAQWLLPKEIEGALSPHTLKALSFLNRG